MNRDLNYIHNALSAHTPSPEGISRFSSVLMPVLETENGYELLFTKRSMTLKRQPGDICFPGGSREGNESDMETALRETWEETGIPPENIQILGKTDYVITAYGSVITPFVGLVKGISVNDLKFSRDEVDSVFTVPLSFFMDTVPDVHYVKIRIDVPDDFPFDDIVGGKNYGWSRGKQSELFYYYNGNVIWGFTARIIHNFCSILKGEI